MSEFQDFCKKILPFVQAGTAGEVVQWHAGEHGWLDVNAANPECFGFEAGTEFRIKPRTIKIGDFDVPEPMRVEPGSGVRYFVVETLSDTPAACQTWSGMDCEKRWLSMGLCHKSKESAIAHAKALIALTSAK